MPALSRAESRYLKAIYTISERSRGAVSTNSIASTVNTSAASVTDMLKRLAEKELIVYEKYRGVQLSELGRARAMELVRKHRLWETFLVNQLGFSWEEVHDIAEQLEYVRSETLVERLDDFLGRPRFDPHGDPIPSAEGRFTLRSQKPLAEMEKGASGRVVAVQEHSRPFLEHLNDLGISLGKKLAIIERYAYDGSLKVSIDGGGEEILTEPVSRKIYIKPE